MKGKRVDTTDTSTDPLLDTLSGTGSDASWLLANGGEGNAYLDNQTPADVLDNGGAAVNTTATGTTVASTTTPSWWQSLTGLASTGVADYQTVAPLINGKPAGSPTPVAPGGATGLNATPIFGIGLGAWILFALLGFGGWLFFRGGNRR